jgi:hypothetical protein
MEVVISLVSLAVIAAVIFLIFRKKINATISVHASIEKIKSVGELIAYRAYVKEIITSTNEAPFWASNSKLLLICKMEIDFSYNLEESHITSLDNSGKYKVSMPPAVRKIHMSGIHLYHEQKRKVFGLFGLDIELAERNRMHEQAYEQANVVAEKLYGDHAKNIQLSAEDTLGRMARSFGASEMVFEFREDKAPQTIENNDS